MININYWLGGIEMNIKCIVLRYLEFAHEWLARMRLVQVMY